MPENSCKFTSERHPERTCTRRASHSGFCIFHVPKPNRFTKEKWEPEQLENWERIAVQFREEFLDLIIRSEEDQQIQFLDFTGFEFPSIRLGRTFEKAVNFSDANFNGRAHFFECVFRNASVFERAQFLEKASFWGVRFELGANFVGVNFTRGADYGTTHFQREYVTVDTAKFDGDISFYKHIVAYIYTSTYIHTITTTHTHIYTYAHTHIHTHHTHIYIYTYLHSQIGAEGQYRAI